MKKVLNYIILLAIIAVIVAASGCSSNNKTPSPTPTETPVATPISTPAPVETTSSTPAITPTTAYVVTPNANNTTQVPNEQFVQNGIHISTQQRILQTEQSNMGTSSTMSNATTVATPSQN
jgi:hypothetical protein